VTRRLLVVIVLMLSSAPKMFAQQAEVVPVRTFTLQQLDVQSAAKLLSPYLQSPMAGAFESGNSARVITVRGTNRELHTVDSLLRIFDRPKRTMLLRFQLLEPTEQNVSDPRIAEASAALREVAPSAGYRLVGEGIARIEDRKDFEVSISGSETWYALSGVAQASNEGPQVIQLEIRLSQMSDWVSTGLPSAFSQTVLFATTVSLINKQIVVLGSAASRSGPRVSVDTAPSTKRQAPPLSGRFIILTVRPEILVRP
jgi:hypothetical protein